MPERIFEDLTEEECDEILGLKERPTFRVDELSNDDLGAMFNDPDRPFDQEINREVIPL